ncbi:MAG: hypothetical protein RBR49_07610 [Desulfovibrio desulfuricans]|nr:hypothetical protein [Desulfovibrio desulfuricans]
MRHELAPIAVFAFNRPDHLGRTLEALAANNLAAESDVTIFCDGPRHKDERELTDAVRSVAKSAQGFASICVVERPRNLGCANSVIDGLKQMFARSEGVIIIEDDILTSAYTLSYLNSALSHFKEQKNIFSISAWAPPKSLFQQSNDDTTNIYFVPRFHCWGWASWRDRFEQIDWDVTDYAKFNASPYLRRLYAQQGLDLPAMLDMQMSGKLNTWDIRADFSRFMRGMVSVNPRHSYTTNIGMGSGTHTTQTTSVYDNDLSLAIQHLNLDAENIYDYDLFREYASLHVHRENFWVNLKRQIKSMVKGHK